MRETVVSPFDGPAIWICGPTAVGKTDLALELALKSGGEVISVDSMQVYVGMDIGTGKPGISERRGVLHHLLDVVRLPETFDAARFVELARMAENEIRNRGKVPIFCGGTGLYFKALSEGLGEVPPGDPEMRKDLEKKSLEELGEEIQKLDPELWQTVDRRNHRRLVRAVEVLRVTGKPFSQQRAEWRKKQSDKRCIDSNITLQIGLCRSREELCERIDKRVQSMFGSGLMEEVRNLVQSGLRESSTACQALGYKQALAVLDGNMTIPQAVAETALRTRQFAKRQMTWFRGQFELKWVELQKDAGTEEVAEMLLKDWKTKMAVLDAIKEVGR